MQVDFAIAYKHLLEDAELDAKKLDSIQHMLKPIGTALGVQYEEPKQDLEEKVMPQDLPIEQVLTMLGGKGTKIVHHE